jgi:glutaminyl-tRNA synthetase
VYCSSSGKDSLYRNRVEGNLNLFVRMRQSEFPHGARVLRAKINMASPNLNMRATAMCRILHAAHHEAAVSDAGYAVLREN